MTLNYQKASP